MPIAMASSAAQAQSNSGQQQHVMYKQPSLNMSQGLQHSSALSAQELAIMAQQQNRSGSIMQPQDMSNKASSSA